METVKQNLGFVLLAFDVVMFIYNIHLIAGGLR